MRKGVKIRDDLYPSMPIICNIHHKYKSWMELIDAGSFNANLDRNSHNVKNARFEKAKPFFFINTVQLMAENVCKLDLSLFNTEYPLFNDTFNNYNNNGRDSSSMIMWYDTLNNYNSFE